MKPILFLFISLVFIQFGLCQNTEKLDSVDYPSHLQTDSLLSLNMKIDSLENLSENAPESKEDKKESESILNSFSGIVFGIIFGALSIIIIHRFKRR